MSLGDIKKLSVKDIEKYFNRYQAVLGKKINGGLLDSSIQLISKVISYIVPVDDIESLCVDLKKDDLVNRELTNILGLLALKAGRLTALASGLFQVAKHVKIGKISEESYIFQVEEYSMILTQLIMETISNLIEGIDLLCIKQI